MKGRLGYETKAGRKTEAGLRRRQHRQAAGTACCPGAGGAPRAAIAMGQGDHDRAEKIMANGPSKK